MICMSPPSASHLRGKTTFYVAAGALLAVAVGQGVVAAWGMAVRDRKAEEAAQIRLATVPEVAQPAPKPAPKTETPAPPPPATIDPPAKTVAGPPEPAPAPRDPLYGTLVTEITNDKILARLDSGLHLREQGDMQGAITELRSALVDQPDHPQLIYQVAYTLDLMGLPAKALPHWQMLQSLGRGAGDYYKLAQNRLSDRPPEASPVSYEDKEGHLRVLGAGVQRDEKFKVGERQVLKFGLQKAGDEAIDVTDVAISIHFFDVVNGRRIDRALTDREPTTSFLALPVNWAEDGIEPVEIEYLRGEMTVDQLKKFGSRSYYGYVLEVYWRDKLQDVKAEPPELADFAREMPTPTATDSPQETEGNPLFPR